MKPHKHAKLIKLWADGAEIEYYKYATQVWVLMEYPNWGVDTEYRVRIESTTTETFIRREKCPSRSKTDRHETFTGNLTYNNNLRMTWDGETLIKAEVI
jgi:hypothetical protein